MSGRTSAEGAAVLDLVFALRGTQCPTDYRYLLWSALRPVLPWMDEEPQAGIVGIGLTQTGSETALLSRRARLTLRVPGHRVGAARLLEGVQIGIGSDAIEVGTAIERPLQATATLYAGFVALDGADELAFCDALAKELAAMDADCPAILGRRRSLRVAGREVPGYPVALHGCTPAQSLRLQSSGVGPERGLGFGIFIPHKKIERIE